MGQSAYSIAMKEMGQLIETANAKQKYLPGPVYNVLGYGAKGDARTDDTKAFQKAIDAASVKGGIVYVPSGEYVCGPIVIAASNVTFCGSGMSSTIYFTSPTGTWLTIRDARDVTVQDLNFENTLNPTSGNVINIDNCAWVIIDHVKMGFYTNIYNGVSITSIRGGVQAVYIRNSFIFKFRGSAITADTSVVGSQTINDIFLENCFIQWLASNVGEIPPSTSIGVKLYSVYAAVQAINITDCEISASYWTFYSVGSRFLRITNSYFDGNNYFETVNISTFSNSWFSGSTGANNAAHTVDINNCVGFQLINCHIDPESVLNSNSSNIIIRGTSNHVKIDGCMLGGAGYVGITLSGGDNILLTGNYFGNNNAFLNPENMATGVKILSSFSGFANMSNNDMREMATKINNAATTSGKIFAQGNLGYNPVGSLSAPAMPSSGSGAVNTYPHRVRISITGGTGVGLFINSVSIGLSSGSFILEPGESIAMTYSTPPTSWVWQGL